MDKRVVILCSKDLEDENNKSSRSNIYTINSDVYTLFNPTDEPIPSFTFLIPLNSNGIIPILIKYIGQIKLQYKKIIIQPTDSLTKTYHATIIFSGIAEDVNNCETDHIFVVTHNKDSERLHEYLQYKKLDVGLVYL